MKYLILSIILLLSVSALHAQWRKVADFRASENGQLDTPVSEPITCIYFLDLPGPPRIGFVGTESSLWRTSDGGNTWAAVWDTGVTYSHAYVSGICFKDSLTGWISVFNGYSPDEKCYRTTDGGKNWYLLQVPSDTYPYSTFGSFGIAYENASGLLFLSCYTKIRISTDLGNTWPDSLPYSADRFSFSDSLHGIISAVGASDIEHDSSTGLLYLVTSDGGLSWDTSASGIPIASGSYEALAMPGSSTCFGTAANGQGVIFRSDDFGRTWRQVGTLPANHLWTGYIAGNFSRLYVQNESSIYVSTDSGVTWIDDGGPGFNFDFDGFIGDHFFAANGVTFAGSSAPDTITPYEISTSSLWEETWPQSGVPAPAPNASFTASASPNPATGQVTLSFSLPAPGEVSVTVLNVLGQRVPGTGLLPSPTMGPEEMATGNHSITLSLAGLPAGIYYARIQTEAGKRVLKVAKE